MVKQDVPAWPAGVSTLALDAPHRASRRLVAAVVAGCAAILLVAMVAFRYDYIRWSILPGFTWAYVTLYLVAGLVTAVLLMQATPETWSRSLALLAAAYIFSALMTVPFLLTFPGAFSIDPVPLVGGLPVSSVDVLPVAGRIPRPRVRVDGRGHVIAAQERHA